jgi:hypothetical protein
MRRFALIAALLAAGCGKKDAAPTEPAADSIWQLAPSDATLVVVAAPGSLRGVAHAIDLARAGMGDMLPLDAVPALIADEQARGGALDLDRAAGLIVTRVGLVIVPPAADAARVSRFAGDEWTCKAVRGFVACTESKEVFAALDDGDGLETVNADWPDAATGAIRLYAALPETPIKAGITLDGGAFDVHAIVESAGAKLPPEVRGGASALASELVAEQPAGFARVRVPLSWLAGRAPPPSALGGLDLGELIGASTGEIVMATFGGASIYGELRFGLADEDVGRHALGKLCSALPVLLPEATVEVGGGACRGSIPPRLLQAFGGVPVAAPVPFAVSVRSGALVIAGGEKPASPAKVPMSEFGRALLTEDWLVAFWGHGSLLQDNQAQAWQSNVGIPGARSVLWALLQFQSAALAVGVRGDDIHARLRVETIYANPPELVSQLESLLVRAADNDAEALAKLRALADEHPDTPFGRSTHAGVGGLMPPVAGVGVVAAIAVPAFAKYQKKRHALER